MLSLGEGLNIPTLFRFWRRCPARRRRGWPLSGRKTTWTASPMQQNRQLKLLKERVSPFFWARFSLFLPILALYALEFLHRVSCQSRRYTVVSNLQAPQCHWHRWVKLSCFMFVHRIESKLRSIIDIASFLRHCWARDVFLSWPLVAFKGIIR